MWSLIVMHISLPLCVVACVVEQLELADFFSASVPKSRLFVTVHDAVLYILKEREQKDFVLVGCNEY